MTCIAGEDGGGPWVYRAETERLESELAERVLELASSSPAKKLRAPESAPAELLPEGIELAGEQWQGIRAAFAHRLSVITGGPGTGKTASIQTIGAIAADQEASLLLVAPTGRAAKRMSEATGIPASTIHSALAHLALKCTLFVTPNQNFVTKV